MTLTSFTHAMVTLKQRLAQCTSMSLRQRDQLVARGGKRGEDAANALLAAVAAVCTNFYNGRRDVAGEKEGGREGERRDMLLKAFANLNGLGVSLRLEQHLLDSPVHAPSFDCEA
ncbi:hypothetical protein BR93DRAFT_965505 [Coniochaeta sp. PMI_546]|nr:hypothetical protein BR93DRAFT_965505 [Coniochaeta sp. PMI_546]